MMLHKEDGQEAVRKRMVTEQIERRGIQAPRILEAFRKVKRHEFIGEDFKSQAYEDHPVEIGFHQTVSQPYIVACMIQMVDLQAGDKVLEIGTGSGYQTALLSELSQSVYTVEIFKELSLIAQSKLKAAGYLHIHFKIGDGAEGWKEHAPYNAIIVSAAALTIPAALIEQMALGGRMVIPVGEAGEVQNLMLVRKDQKAHVTTQPMELVRFVPLRPSR